MSGRGDGRPCLLRVVLPLDSQFLRLLEDLCRELAAGVGSDPKAAERLSAAVVDAVGREIDVHPGDRMEFSFQVRRGELQVELIREPPSGAGTRAVVTVDGRRLERSSSASVPPVGPVALNRGDRAAR